MDRQTIKRVLFFVLMWTIFKVFIECVTVLLLLFMLCFFGHKACGILAPRPGIKPTPPALEGKVLATEHQGSPTTRPLNSYISNASQTFTEWLPRAKLGDHRDEIGFVSALKYSTSKVP